MKFPGNDSAVKPLIASFNFTYKFQETDLNMFKDFDEIVFHYEKVFDKDFHLHEEKYTF